MTNSELSTLPAMITRRGASFPVRPVVIVVMAYLMVCSAWSLWTLATARFPEAGEPLRLVTLGQLAVVTCVNVALAVAVTASARQAWRGAPAMRRAHLAGAGLAALALVLVQVGVTRAYG